MDAASRVPYYEDIATDLGTIARAVSVDVRGALQVPTSQSFQHGSEVCGARWIGCVFAGASFGVVDAAVVGDQGEEAARGEEGAEVGVDGGVGDGGRGEDAVARRRGRRRRGR
jgi:hypothetical protein